MIQLFAVILIINIVGIFLGWLLTENNCWSLAKLSRLFDRKPFNCRPCLTFHLLWIMYGCFSLIMQSWSLWLVGFVLAFIVFGGLYAESKSKIEE